MSGQQPKEKILTSGHTLDSAFTRGEITNVHASAKKEKPMGLRTVTRLYYKAAFWSAIVFFSCALVMEGYNLGVINSFWAQPNFLQHFDCPNAQGKLYVPANWQAVVNNAALIGEMIGLILNGYLSPWWGAKKTYLLSMSMMIAALFIPVFLPSIQVLFIGEWICGISWGIFQTLTTAYAAEICPLALRGLLQSDSQSNSYLICRYMTAFVNLCWGVGLTLALGVVRDSIEIEGQMAWRLPHIIQFIWPVPLFCIVLFAPESPWWLVRQGRFDDAKSSLRQLAAPGHWTGEDLSAQVSLMKHMDEIEKAEVAGATFADCFRKSNLRCTEIVACVWGFQYFCGQPMINYTMSFLSNAGLSEDNSFIINLVMTTMFIIGTLCCWIFFSKIGQRTLYLWGSGGMALALGIIGILECFPENNSAIWGLGGMMIALNFVYNITVGPICYTIVGKMPATRVRQQSVVIAQDVYLVCGVVIQQLVPRMLSPEEWNWGGRLGFFFLGTNLIYLAAYCYLRLPESKGRTYGKLDILFEDKVPARRFARTMVDVYEQHNLEKTEEKFVERSL